MMTIAEPPHDTPRTAYRALEARATVSIAGLVAPLFLLMWATMVVAMMMPTVAPIVLLHRIVMRRAGRGAVSTVLFATGYLVTWTALGLVPLAALVAFGDATAQASWVPRAGGAVLLVAGLYQFTAWKDACLRACRTPMGFLMSHRFAGFGGEVRAGASHGLYCIGCCWALMAVLFVGGLMNLTWMAVVALVFLAEKNWSHSVALTRVVGTAVTVLGIAVLADPSLLVALAGLSSGEPMPDGM